MKKQRNHSTSKAGVAATGVYAILSEPRTLNALVNELARRRSDIGYCLEKVHEGWQPTDTSSIEIYASGDLHLTQNGEPTTISFDTAFLFTCIKTKGADYHLTWANSLS